MCVHVEAKLRQIGMGIRAFQGRRTPTWESRYFMFPSWWLYVPKPRAQMASSSKALKESDLLRLFKAFKGFYIIITILTPV